MCCLQGTNALCNVNSAGGYRQCGQIAEVTWTLDVGNYQNWNGNVFCFSIKTRSDQLAQCVIAWWGSIWEQFHLLPRHQPISLPASNHTSHHHQWRSYNYKLRHCNIRRQRQGSSTGFPNHVTTNMQSLGAWVAASSVRGVSDFKLCRNRHNVGRYLKHMDHLTPGTKTPVEAVVITVLVHIWGEMWNVRPEAQSSLSVSVVSLGTGRRMQFSGALAAARLMLNRYGL